MKENVIEKTLLLASLLPVATFADGYASGWSDWSTQKSGISGEQSKVQYRSADVTAFSSCDASHIEKPSDEYYKEGKYDPKNCYWSSQGSCNSWVVSSWSCNDWRWKGEWCRSAESCWWMCSGCGWWNNTWHSGWYYYGCSWDWVCSNNGWECNSWTPSAWTCNGYENVEHWDGSCGSTATCYATPTSWSTWSEWKDAQITKTTSRKVETRTVYSYPLSYIINYNANGGSGSMSDTKASYTTNTTLSDNTFSRTGYTFLGWSTSSGATSASFANGASVTASQVGASAGGSITLYAVWAANSYILTYNPNGGSVSPTNKTLTYGSVYGDLPTPTRTGYAFKGWFTALSGGTQVSSFTTMRASNTTIYAQWDPIYDVYQVDVLYDGNNIVQTTDPIKPDANYALKTIKVCKKTIDTTDYPIGIGKNHKKSGSQINTDGCTIIK